MDELSTLDAIAQAELVRTGEVSAWDLVSSAIDRIEADNPAVNAIIYDCFEAALEQAAHPVDGPFAGVPLLLKDSGCPVRGHPDHRGSQVLKRIDHRSDHDAALARRLRSGGFIVLGRTNAPELGLASDTWNAAYGATLNPWDLTRTPGGSSGGSAAAVAAGMTPVAHGNDGGGSIRMPASHCGLVGLKPSRGRVSEAPAPGEPAFGHLASGVLTRSIRDTAAVLDLIAGPEPGDPTLLPKPASSYLDAASCGPRQLRIGFVARSTSRKYKTDAACTAAVERAALLFDQVGHHVEQAWPVALFDEQFWSAWFDALSVGVTLEVDEITRLADGVDVAFDPITELWAHRGRELSAVDLTARLRWLDDYRRRMAGWWAEGHDILITPVLTAPPARSRFLWSYRGGIEDSVGILQFTPQFNTTGQPAISVPFEWTDEGLPVGIQLVGAYGMEDVLLSVAAQLEELRPWAHRYPAPADRSAPAR